MRILVIGSGFGGLAAAIRLQAQGHDVTIVEKLDKAGGRAYVFEQDGFTFDAGPTIITAPWLLHDLFELCGARTSDYLELQLLDPFYNIRFEDGSVFHYNGDPEHLRREVARFNPGDVTGYDRFVARTRDIFKAGMALIDKPFPSYASMLKVAPDLVRLRADQSVAKYAGKFVQDDRLRQVFSFHPLLVGGNPFQTSSIYALIHTLEREWGVWFARGGTGALVQALVRLFTDIGGTIRYNSEVAGITVDRATRRATGVTLAGGEAPGAEAVVSNRDVAPTYRRLVPASAPP
ncbi:MAG TPA: phytoene desaturase family protein, partial [Gemmatimonadaceae bacterium]|nr:phytoene desaturase family protein [Gemmatimonadaceae bacterium]